jgi:hypothetical protein
VERRFALFSVKEEKSRQPQVTALGTSRKPGRDVPAIRSESEHIDEPDSIRRRHRHNCHNRMDFGLRHVQGDRNVKSFLEE